MLCRFCQDFPIWTQHVIVVSPAQPSLAWQIYRENGSERVWSNSPVDSYWTLRVSSSRVWVVIYRDCAKASRAEVTKVLI